MSITIGGRKVGPSEPVWIVAELSGNAGQDYKKAEALIEAAASAGASAVKTQAFTPDMLTLDCYSEPFWITWRGQHTTLHRLYEQTAMPWHWHVSLAQCARYHGLSYFCSVFSVDGIRLAQKLGLSCLKLASFEMSDPALVEACAEAHLPLILSTGTATMGEIHAAVISAEMRGAGGLALLHCTSAYPAPVTEANLATIPKLRRAFPRAVIGLSDHTCSNAVVSAAVALGACVVERHLKLDGDDDGPDAQFSDTPGEFADLVACIRNVESALGTPRGGPTPSEATKLRRSLWVVEDMRAGMVFTERNVRSLRPSDGLPPRELPNVLGRRTRVDLTRGTALAWSMLED